MRRQAPLDDMTCAGGNGRRDEVAPHPLFPGRKFISTVLEVLDGKDAMSASMRGRYLQRAAVAGFFVGMFLTAYFTVLARFAAVSADAPWMPVFGRVLGCLTFGWSLVFIYHTNSELLTSNMMIVSVGAYHRRISWARALRLLALCLAGNLLGGLAIAALLSLSSVVQGDVLAQMAATSAEKLAYVGGGAPGLVDLFVRGVLCNFCINVGMLMVYNGKITSDLAKCVVMLVAVFVFAYLGLEHSIADSALFLIVGLRQGIDVGAAILCVLVVLAGNFVGGGLLIGLNFAVMNDERGRRSR